MIQNAAERATLEGYLKEAEAQLHRARMGKATSRIRHGDKDQTFVATSVSELISYVDSLRAKLGLPTNRQSATTPRLG